MSHSFTQQRLMIVVGLAGLAWPLAPGLSAAESPSPASESRAPVFESDVLPILTAHCFKCHGFEGRKAGLDLRSVALMLRGGEHGAVIAQGSSKDSVLFKRISERSMPPEKELPLTDAKIELIGRWLDAGGVTAEAATPSESDSSGVTAEDRQFWSFKKPVRPAVPRVRDATSARTTVDAFILEKLAAKSLGYSPPADRRALARRAAFDITGLPPAPALLAEFLADTSQDAYPRFLDRLLASPHFGERWGRHWLDAAGYVDTIGDDTDAAITKVSTNKWLYRDYVVRAFNTGKPLDRFVVEQLAGDELVDWQSADVFIDETKELLVATGMLRTAADETLQNELNTADIRQAVLEHTMEVVANNLLGLTVHCAKCHSHKFDPIPHEDYYRLLAVFSPAFNHQTWLQPAQRELADIPRSQKEKFEAENREIDARIAVCNVRLEALRQPHRERLAAARLAQLPEEIRADAKKAVDTPADKRNEVQKYLAGKFESKLKVTADDVTGSLAPAEKSDQRSLLDEIATLGAGKKTWGVIQAVYDVGPPSPTYLLRRGNLDRPADEVAPGILRVLCASDAESDLKSDRPGVHSSGRRLALARSLTRPNSAAAGLLARVYVNRAWQHLFGQGIVATSENLGHSGARPTHPELLDWLAVEFQSGGWQVKPLLKLLMTSNVYMQASRRERSAGGALDPETIDPANELLWRMRIRQIESESVRDAILATSGALEASIGGPPTMIEGQPDGTIVIEKKKNPPRFVNRRSMYLIARRRYNLSLLDAFDQPEMTSNCTRRAPSAVVSQSLAMLNDDFVLEQADLFAKRVERDGAAAPVECAFELALGRAPEAAEAGWAHELLRQQAERYQKLPMPPAEATHKALAHLCQMLLNTNEFLYVP